MDILIVITSVVTLIGGIVTLFLLMRNGIDAKIEERISNPILLEKVAKKAQLPFVVFDENNKVIYDMGAYEYLNKLAVHRDEKGVIKEITISPKRFLTVAPIIECINENIDFYEPERASQIDWVIKINKEGPLYIEAEESKQIIKKFKLTIIK